MTFSERLSELSAKHGGLRAVGRVLNIDHTYLSRLANGEKLNPSDATLRKLGMKRVVTYECVARMHKG